MKKLEIKTVSSLEKIMPEMACNASVFNCGSALLNEVFSYQIAFKGNINLHTGKELKLEIESDIKECVSIFNSRSVPVLMNQYWDEPDDNYISLNPGLFPDVLEPYAGFVHASSHIYSAVWVDVKINENVKPGSHNIKIMFIDDEGEVWGESNFALDVIGKKLPKLDVPYTNWFHCDCISSYYDCEPLSERHWDLIDKFMKMATEHGMNMILTPVFTPALDTKIGSERPTVQLVDIFCEDEKYSFDFEKLSRWLSLCRKNGIEYLEIAHFYSQWGAEHTPKIEVTENGERIKKFGWHTDSLSDEYKNFLSQFISALKEFFTENWDKEKVYFHISDEPNTNNIERYGNLHRFIRPLLGDFKHMDAMSDYEIYEKGYVEVPVITTRTIGDFIKNNVKNLWAYYCCGEGKYNLSNRFIAMPSFRNRIIGAQLYKYDIKGFLQWGYNFYYSILSTHLVNPFLVTDSEGGFPSGDAFSVYPGRNEPLPSIRLKVFNHGLQDMMAFKLLESLNGKDAVMELIEKDGEIDFNNYPANPEYILNLREKVNRAIKNL